LCPPPQEHLIRAAAVDLPGIDDVGVGDGGVIVGAHAAEQVAVGVEVQHTGVWQDARR